MKNKILYKRWDNVVFEIELQPQQTNSQLFTINSVIRKDKCTKAEAKTALNHTNLEFLLDTDMYGTDLDYIKLSDDNNMYIISRESFLKQIELECSPHVPQNRAIMVDTLNQLMDVIQFYRYKALFIRIKALVSLCYAISPSSTSTSSTFFERLNDLINNFEKQSKIEYFAVVSENKSQMDSDVHECFKKIKEEYNQYREKGFTLSNKEASVFTAIETTFTLYSKGENFLYYRGVGHIVYPESPSSLRGDRKYYEDTYYRTAKTKHPNELANLCYLDRIAKIQHYGWPSRLMDVTSNPLAAVYMACNTIYTTDDPKQKDYGEIILYFRDEMFEKSYDSKSVLIAAALVKLTYSERKTMFEFINMHDKYFSYDSSAKSDEKALRAVLNLCLRIAVERGCNATLKQHEIRQIMFHTKKGNQYFRKCKTPSEYIYQCMRYNQGSIKKHDPCKDQRLRFYCKDEASSSEADRYPLVFTQTVEENEYKLLFLDFVSAYDRLLVTIRRENPAFQNKIDIFTIARSYHVCLGMTNDRILAQAGSFIIAGLDDAYINDKMLSSRTKEYCRIIINNKKKLFEQLKLLNINDSTMLPDLQHTGEYYTKQYS